jgi:hypothetical protein
MYEKTLPLIRLLIARLERISADSVWAHRASGVRGALLNVAEQTEDEKRAESYKIKQLVDYAFQILKDAAKAKDVHSARVK